MSQDIFFSIGCAGSKAGSRDRAIEQAMRVLDSVEVGNWVAILSAEMSTNFSEVSQCPEKVPSRANSLLTDRQL